MSPQSQSIIELEHVSLQRNGRRILDDVSLRVTRGEYWVILGPNGCGKTTLLNIITGYLWPTSGTVTVLGGKYGEIDLREKRREIGLVSSALFERMPAGDTFFDIVVSGKYASLGMYREPTVADRDRARDIIAFLGREQVSDSPYRVLSFGERQSALIGRALMALPSLLILDEPYEGLDLPTREHFIQRLEILLRDPNGPAVLFVTHRVEEISPGITHAALIREGRMLTQGPKAEALTSRSFREAFGIEVDLASKNGRMYAHIAG